MEYKNAGVLAKRFIDRERVLGEAGWKFSTIPERSRSVRYYL
jgi:hypothetical protein